jgi:hypothetical protein
MSYRVSELHPICRRSTSEALKTIGNITDVVISGSQSIAQIAFINSSGVVEAQSLIDGLGRVSIVQLLKVGLEVLRAGHDHIGDIILCSFSNCQPVKTHHGR